METTGRGAIEYQKSFSVDGVDYKSHALAPTKALKIALKLSQYVAEPMAEMAQAATAAKPTKNKKDSAEFDNAAVKSLPKAVRALFEKMDEDELIQLTKDLVSTCTHQNQQISFEEHFQARLGHLLKVVTEVVQYQFNDFFSVIGQAIAEIRGKA